MAAALAGVLLLGGCTSLAPDLSVPGLGPVTQGLSIEAPAPPAAPQPTLLTPCPPGWSELARDGGPSTCEPWAADAGPACAADQARFPGEPSCRTVGAPCGADDWASGLPDAGVLYVKAGAVTGGTGTRAAPFGTLAEALSAATAGATLALSKGTFAEDVALPGAVALWGACTLETRVQSVSVGGAGAALSSLTVSGPAVGITVNGSSKSLTLTGVVVDGAVGVGILAGNNARVTGSDVVVRRTKLSPATGHGGRGIDVELSGRVALQGVALEDNHENAVYANGSGTAVTLSDASIRNTLARGDGVMGRAATVSGHAALELTRAVLEGNREVGVLTGDGSTLTLTDVLLRDTLGADNDGTGGNALVAETGGTLKLSRCAMVRNRDSTIQVRAGAHLQASHLVIEGTLPVTADGSGGVALDVEDAPSAAALDHAFIANSALGGVGFKASTGSLADVEVVETRSGGGPSDAVQLMQGASVTLQRVRLNGNVALGLVVDGAGTSVTGSDVTVEQTELSAQAGNDGTALAVQHGAQLTLSRVRLSQNHTVALLLSEATVTLEDLLLQETSSDRMGDWGRGLHVQGVSTVKLTRAVIDSSADVGLFVASASTVNAESLRVKTTAKRACVAAGTCADQGGSAVVVLGDGSSLDAVQFSFDHSAQCGVQLAQGGVATLKQGEIRRHPIGACVATQGFDVARISDGVTYVDNTRNLDAEVLPLPTAVAPTPPTH